MSGCYTCSGEIAPALAATYPLTDLPAAQRDFLSKTHSANIVVLP